MQLSEHLEADGPLVFAHACKLGLEHRVEAARLALPLGALTALDQEQEPGAPAARREAEEDWGR